MCVLVRVGHEGGISWYVNEGSLLFERHPMIQSYENAFSTALDRYRYEQMGTSVAAGDQGRLEGYLRRWLS